MIYYTTVILNVSFGTNPKNEKMTYPIKCEIGFDSAKVSDESIAVDFQTFLAKKSFFKIIYIFNEITSQRAFDRIPFFEGIDTLTPYYISVDEVVSFQLLTKFEA